MISQNLDERDRTITLGTQSFTIPNEVFDSLKEIARKRKIDELTVILQAISTEIFLWEALQNPKAKLLLEDNTTIKELTFKI